MSVGYSGPPGHGDPPPSVSWPHTVNTINHHDPQSPYAIPQMSSSHLPPPQYPPVDPPITPLSQTVNPTNPPSAHPVKGNNTGVGFQSRISPPHLIIPSSLQTMPHISNHIPLLVGISSYQGTLGIMGIRLCHTLHHRIMCHITL